MVAEEERDASRAPLDVIRMRSEEQNIYRHRFHSGALDGGTMPFNLR